jgi:hypothetical protein
MKKRKLKEWLSHGGLHTTMGKRKLSRLMSRLKDLPLALQPLKAGEAEVAWQEVAHRITRAVHLDIRSSDEAFLWDALKPFAQTWQSSSRVPITSEEWLVLLEEKPSLAFSAKCVPLEISRLGSPLPDLYVLPWPRLNWILMITHEPDIGPFYLSLK